MVSVYTQEKCKFAQGAKGQRNYKSYCKIHCNKLKHKKLGLRVVFREYDSRIEIIEIVVIDKRTDAEVYTTAERRLGR